MVDEQPPQPILTLRLGDRLDRICKTWPRIQPCEFGTCLSQLVASQICRRYFGQSGTILGPIPSPVYTSGWASQSCQPTGGSVFDAHEARDKVAITVSHQMLIKPGTFLCYAS